MLNPGQRTRCQLRCVGPPPALRQVPARKGDPFSRSLSAPILRVRRQGTPWVRFEVSSTQSGRTGMSRLDRTSTFSRDQTSPLHPSRLFTTDSIRSANGPGSVFDANLTESIATLRDRLDERLEVSPMGKNLRYDSVDRRCGVMDSRGAGFRRG